MKTITRIGPVCAILVSIFCSLTTSASTVTASYEVSAAVADLAYYGSSHQHALYLPTYATDLVFEPGARFTIFSDGTGTLTATAFSLSNPGLVFDVALDFTGLTDTPGSGGPKEELQSHAYVENGGPVNVADWYYFASWTGVLTGSDDADGVILDLIGRGAPFQWGIGANGKNIEFGGSGWFYSYDQDGVRTTGDFNLNAQPVPLPAGLPLMIVAMLSLGMISRRGQ